MIHKQVIYMRQLVTLLTFLSFSEIYLNNKTSLLLDMCGVDWIVVYLNIFLKRVKYVKLIINLLLASTSDTYYYLHLCIYHIVSLLFITYTHSPK